MKLAATQQLFAYWDALRGVRAAPERNDVEPGALRGVIADTFILEFRRADGFPMRVVGGRTAALFCRPLRGDPFLDLWDAKSLTEVARVIEGAADDAQPFLLGGRAAPDGAAPVDFEALILPLRHHGATHARTLGALTPGASAPWFGLLPLRPMALQSFRALNRQRESSFGAARPTPERRKHLFVYSARQQQNPSAEI